MTTTRRVSEATLRRLAAVPSQGRTDGLAKRIMALETSDKFRLAARLLMEGHAALAQAVAQQAIDEIDLSWVQLTGDDVTA